MRKLTFEEYAIAAKEALGGLAEGDVELHEAVRNNGKRTLNIIITESGKTNVSPIISLEGFYNEYMGTGFTESIYSILEAYEKNRVKGRIDLQFMDSYENVKGRILPRLINYDKNMELLKHTPHVRHFDLAVVFHCLKMDRDGQYASILVTDALNGKWRKTESELFHDGLCNMERQIYRNPLFDELNMLMGHDIQKEEWMDEGAYKLCLLSNCARFYGASAMLSKKALREAAEEMGCSRLAILPSSVHEALLLPQKGDMDMEGLRGIVESINQSSVIRTEDFLSDSIYVYDKEADKAYAL